MLASVSHNRPSQMISRAKKARATSAATDLIANNSPIALASM